MSERSMIILNTMKNGRDIEMLVPLPTIGERLVDKAVTCELVSRNSVTLDLEGGKPPSSFSIDYYVNDEYPAKSGPG